MICKLLHNMLDMRHGDHAINVYVRVQRGIHPHPSSTGPGEARPEASITMRSNGFASTV